MESFIPQTQGVMVVGVNHRSAGVALRETLAFSRPQVADAIDRLREMFPGCEAAILSTCNRVELYIGCVGESPPDVESLLDFMAQYHNVSAHEFLSHAYHHTDRAAVEHLFLVASSLDSMVVGETQILAQVRHAYRAACERRSAGALFHALFQRAIAAAKEVHETTALSAGRVSVAGIAVHFVKRVFDRFDDKCVVCVGAGKMADLMLRHMRALSPGKLAIVNRSVDRGRELAAKVGGTAHGMESLRDLLIEADIVLTGTGATEPIITEAGFGALLRPRRYRPAVIVDVALPRDVEEGVGRLTNVYLYNLDDLQDAAAGNREKRLREIAASREIVNRHVDAFMQWHAGRQTGPVVKGLYEFCREVAGAELEAFFAKNPALDEASRKQVERLAHRVIGKILHRPVRSLTEGATEMSRPALLAAVRALFELPEDGEGKRSPRTEGQELAPPVWPPVSSPHAAPRTSPDPP